jgi:hypothetical protein
MTTLRQAAQQALEALEFMADEWGFTQKANRPERGQAIEALRDALVREGCTYTVKEMDGFGTAWTTECGEGLYVAAPEAIGFSLAPMPNANGKFCRFCGNKITLKGKK